MSARHRPFAPTVALAGLWLACAAAPAAAQALYKLVAPDGAVTYTDRPPAGGNLRVESLGRTEGGAGSPALPQALREAAARFPVVLYTLPDCAPCDRGRDLLRSRGVPLFDREIVTPRAVVVKQPSAVRPVETEPAPRWGRQ